MVMMMIGCPHCSKARLKQQTEVCGDSREPGNGSVFARHATHWSSTAPPPAARAGDSHVASERSTTHQCTSWRAHIQDDGTRRASQHFGLLLLSGQSPPAFFPNELLKVRLLVSGEDVVDSHVHAWILHGAGAAVWCSGYDCFE